MMTASLLAAAMLAAVANQDAFFKEFAQKRQGIVTLQANFEQVSVLPDERLSTDGSLLYCKPRRILYRTAEPERATLVDGRYGYEYEPDIKQLVMYDLEEYPQVDAFFLGFDEDIISLRKSYQVEVFEVKGGKESGTRGIKLKPKPEDADNAFFREVSIYLRDKDLLPYRIRIDSEEDSWTLIEIDQASYVINGQVSPKQTQIFVAQGTSVVLDDEVIRTVGDGGEYLPDAAPNAIDAEKDLHDAPTPDATPSPDGPEVEIHDLPPPAAAPGPK